MECADLNVNFRIISKPILKDYYKPFHHKAIKTNIKVSFLLGAWDLQHETVVILVFKPYP